MMDKVIRLFLWLAWTLISGGVGGGKYAEGSTVGDANGEIGEDSEETVGKRGAEGQVVADLVNREEEVLSGRCANDVGGKEEAP